MILYAGTFQPYEGLDLLVRAIGLIVRNRPSAHLVIVGGSAGFAHGRVGAARKSASCSPSFSETGVADHVTFTGRIPHAEVKDMYAMADVVAYPRRLTRTTALTTPLKPLEAMAMAKPVVASDVPPMRELVSGRADRRAVPRRRRGRSRVECIASSLRNSALREQLGSGAREWVVRERQWPTLVAQIQDVYQSVVKHPRHVADAAAKADIQVPAWNRPVMLRLIIERSPREGRLVLRGRAPRARSSRCF